MRKRIVFAVFVLVIAHCVLTAPLIAQNADPCLIVDAWAFGEGQWPFGWFYVGEGAGLFSYLIGAKKCPPKPEHSSCPKAGSPICLTSGNVYVEDQDVSVPGLGGGLNLSRRWNSVLPANEILFSVGIFGPNWRSTYEESIFMGTDSYAKYSRSDGFWSFGAGDSIDGTLITVSPASASVTLIQVPSGLLLKFPSGEQRLFGKLVSGGTTPMWLLTAIIDRNGNQTQISYDSSNRLVTVTSPASQHLYFNYGSGSSSNLVTSVTTDFGVTLSYSYDAQGRLTQVTKPDLTTMNYTYDSGSHITAVTDSNGKVLESHTYGESGYGLTSSQANGVNAVTVSYQ